MLKIGDRIRIVTINIPDHIDRVSIPSLRLIGYEGIIRKISDYPSGTGYLVLIGGKSFLFYEEELQRIE